MKKSLLAVVAALAIAGCSQTEIEGIDNGSQTGKAEMKFNSIVSKGSRATVANLDALKNGFYVYAYNTASEVAGTGTLDKAIMTKEKISYAEGTGWTSANTYYWPASDNVQFFAFYAEKSTSLALTASASDTYPTIVDYTVGANENTQEDLLVAKAINKTKTDGTITFQFTHALTQVNFSVKPKSFKTGLTYKVTAMSIEGVNSKATYDYGTEKWGTPSTSANYTIFSGEKAITTADAVPMNSSAFILLPQTCNATIKVSYTVTDSNDQVLYTATDKTATTTMTWQSNQNIRYTIELPDDITSITFGEPSISDGWKTEIEGTGTTQPAA